MKRYFLITILSMFILSACVPKAKPTTTVTPVEQVVADVEQEATETPIPETTDTPLPEVKSTEEVVEPTATETPTLTATVNLFADASIISYWYINDSTMIIAIEVPGGVPKGKFTATVESVEYSCEVLPNYPGRLYCSGPVLTGGERVVVSVLSDDNKVFEGVFIVPEQESGFAEATPDGEDEEESGLGEATPDGEDEEESGLGEATPDGEDEEESGLGEGPPIIGS